MNVKTIQSIVGHASVELTLNVYAHLINKGSSPLLEYIYKLKTAIEAK